MTDHEENLPKRPRLSFEGEPDDGLMDLEDDLSSIPDADTSMETSQADSENHDGLEITPQSKNALLDIYAVAGRAAPQVIAPKAKDANPSTSTDTAADDAFSIGPSSVLPSGSIFDELAQEREQRAAEAEQEEAAETVLESEEESREVHIEDEDFGDLDSQESDEYLEAQVSEEVLETEPEVVSDDDTQLDEIEVEEALDEQSESVSTTDESDIVEEIEAPVVDDEEDPEDTSYSEDSGETQADGELEAEPEPEAEPVLEVEAEQADEPADADETVEEELDDLVEDAPTDVPEAPEEPEPTENAEVEEAAEAEDNTEDSVIPEVVVAAATTAAAAVATTPEPEAPVEPVAETPKGRGTTSFGLLLARLSVSGILLLQACQTFFTVGDNRGIPALKATFDGANAGDLVSWGIPILEVIAALFLLVGVVTPLGTTLAIAVSSFMTLHQLDLQDGQSGLADGTQLWILLTVASIALAFTGPGRIAVDGSRGFATRPKLSGVLATLIGLILAGVAWVSLVGGNPLA